MTKKVSSWTLESSLMASDSELMKTQSRAMKGDQSQNLEKVEVNSSMADNLDASSLMTDEPNTVLAGENSMKILSATSKRTHKHKHHHCHRHHHHHHHHRRHHRVTKPTQQPRIVYREASQKNSHAKTSINIPDGIKNKPISIDVHQKSSIASSDDQTIKSSKGNIPLQSIENKLVSQRATSTDETQVENCSSVFYTQPTSSCVCTDSLQQIEQIIYTDDCCIPSSSYIVQQPETVCCVPQQQQQQQQLFLCTEPTSAQDYICSSSATAQPTIINQIPFLNTSSINTSSQQFLCLPQSSPSIIIQQQQPQIQAQPIQIIQAPQTQSPQYLQISSGTPQIIQTIQAPQGPSAQYLQVSSATPQFIQTIQAPAGQSLQMQPFIQAIQVPTQAMAASPQILYQRPYDPIMMPVQNRQIAFAQAPGLALSRPSYAPARRGPPGPRMFQHALVRTVAGRVGVPVPGHLGGLPQLSPPAPLLSLTRGAAFASNARALVNDSAQPSTSLPIVPLTAGGLLIPFQPSDPTRGTAGGAFPRSNLRNFDNIRQQIQQRAQVLAELQRLNSARVPSLPVRSINTASPPSIFSRNLSRPGFGPTLNAPISSSLFSPSAPTIPQPPPIIRSQTPYIGGNTFGTSSSSNSSRSSASSILPPLTAQTALPNLPYSAPSLTNPRGDSTLSRPSAPYQSLRP